jgi:mannose-1-phosphate guanylyltransferase/mannose-6-phosphate isomerase
MYASILAGGSGTRLWPLSTSEHPKQFLTLMSTFTMLQETVQRIEPLMPLDHQYVITSGAYAAKVREQLPGMAAGNVVAEPSGRGTVASIGLAAALIAARDPQAVMGSFHSDAAINDAEGFRAAVQFAETLAREGELVTLGITPTYPETGYGYIHYGAPLRQSGALTAHLVQRFIEKPPLAEAERYVQSGAYGWNSGIFIWRVDRILHEIRRFVPQVADVLDAIGHIARRTGGQMTPEVESVMREAWTNLSETITIDVGVAERVERLVVIPMEVGWSDVGSWSQVASLLPADAAGNTSVGVPAGNLLALDTHGTLVYSTTGRPVATIGLSDFVIVDTGDALLVCPKSQCQRVKDIVDLLKRRQAAPE